MSDCPNCTAASEREHWEFRAGCIGCRARSAARSPLFFAAKKTGRQDRAYRALLEQLSLTHELVREAAQADAYLRNRSSTTA